MAEGEGGVKEPIQASKRESGISKIIGWDEEKRKGVESLFNNLFENQLGKRISFEKDYIEKLEREKTKEEREIIREVLNRISQFVEKYGGNPLLLTLEHIHILDISNFSEETKKLIEKEGGRGFYSSSQQFFCILDIGNNLEKVDTIIHELLHFNSFQSVEKLDWKIIKSNTRMRRGGITIASYDKKQQLYPSHIYFEGLNEAIIEELTIRFGQGNFELIPELQRELIDKNTYGYSEERKKLKEIIEKIYETNKDLEHFNSSEDVFYIFAKAVMSGKTLKIARLIEKTYGKGSFRKLGEETKNKK